MSGATLRLLDRADKEIAKLPRNMRGAVWDFMHKFRIDPTNPGLRFKALKEHGADERLFSARVTDDYRALLLHLGGDEYLLVSVKHRRDAYAHLDRFSYGINRITGGIEVIDITIVESRIRSSEPPPQQQQPDAVAADPQSSYPLFAAFSDAELTELGVTPALLRLIRKITSEAELEELIAGAPQLTAEVLVELHGGRSPEEVLEYVTRPQAAPDEVDPEDYRAALARPATIVSSDDDAVQGALGEEFARWQVFLHPNQRRLVERRYNGPARVSGGPGTGKTIVALHRVKHLARNAPRNRKSILLTTFTKNLAEDLGNRLRELGGSELADRVEVAHVDAVAAKVLIDGGALDARPVSDRQVVKEWRDVLAELGETRWTAEFLAEEWSEVILGQVINSRAEYFKARRPGRGRLTKPDRDEVWRLVESFTKRLDDRKLTTFRQRAERAARVEMARDARIREKAARDERADGPHLHAEAGSGAFLKHRYDHVVVDEAQDLNPAHWKLLRALVAAKPDDIFIVGDTHQRIYENRISLGSLGINIRGRSARLTLSYRTTRQILGSAIGLLKGEVYDDLDGGTDHLDGYRSILKGALPRVEGFTTWDEEKAAIVEQVRTWSRSDEGTHSIGVSTPTRDKAEEVVWELGKAGLTAVELGKEGKGTAAAVRVGTMHGCKGLEFQHMVVAGISDGLVPRHVTGSRKQAERQRQLDRSLLFVAATRARDTLLVTYHGQASPFLLPLRVR